jgi:hypothetical protein
LFLTNRKRRDIDDVVGVFENPTQVTMKQDTKCTNIHKISKIVDYVGLNQNIFITLFFILSFVLRPYLDVSSPAGLPLLVE